jgi:hypothetical protein
MCQCWFIYCNKCVSLEQDEDEGEDLVMCGEEADGNCDFYLTLWQI